MPETPDPLEAMARAMFDRWFEQKKGLPTDEQFRESDWMAHGDEFRALAKDALTALSTTPLPEGVIQTGGLALYTGETGWNWDQFNAQNIFRAMTRKLLEKAA